MKDNEGKKLKLKDVKVIFASLEDEGYGRSITIDATDSKVKEQITSWVKENNIGKDNPGVPKFKEYTNEKTGETTTQFAFKLNDYTKYAGINGLSQENLGYGAIVDLIAMAFDYANKFTGGKTRTGQSVSAVVIKSGASSGGDADLQELLGEVAEEPENEVKAGDIPFN